MTARILDGRAVAEEVFSTIASRTDALSAAGVHPRLAFVMIGESPPARMYVNRLEKLGARVGITVSRRQLPESVSLADLDRVAAELSNDDTVDGILVQLPLPEGLSSDDLSAIIDPRKDVDGLTIHNAGCLYLGIPGEAPSTGLAMMQILASNGIDPLGQHAVVVGRSNVVGHPVTELLLQRDATVTVTHRQTRGLATMTRLADILLVGAGSPRLITADMIRPGAVVIDAGINVEPGGLVGDVDFDACVHVAGAITPVPGGVGPVTNAVLLRNLVDCAERRRA